MQSDASTDGNKGGQQSNRTVRPVADNVDKTETQPPTGEIQRNRANNEPPKSAAPPQLKNQKWTLYLAYCTFTIITGSSIMLGFNMAVINAPYAVMSIYINESFYREGQVLDKEQLSVWWSVVVALHLIGGFVGSVWFPAAIAAALGKRNALIVSAGIGALGAFCSFITPWTHSYVPLLVGRGIVGFSTGVSMVIGTPLINEHSPASLRGDTGGHMGNGSPAGLFFANILGITYILGKAATWQYLFLIVGGVYVVDAICLFFVVDSPKDLIARKKDDEALQALMKLRNLSREDTMPEFEMIRKAIRAESEQQAASVKMIFTRRAHWWPFILVICVHVANQLSGMGAAYYYATKTLVESGLSVETAALANLGISFATVVGNLLGAFLADGVGRRIIQLTAIGLLIGSNVMLCICIVFRATSAAAVGFSILLFAFGLGPCPITYIMTPELTSRPAKPLAMVVGMMFNWAFRAAVSFVFPVMALRIGGYSFLPFAGFCTFFFLFFFFFLPETSSRLADYDAEDYEKPGSLWQFRPRQKKQQQVELSERPDNSDKPNATDLSVAASRC